ncbi:hypothetical protein BHS09_09020 [Myxococcus xanthus]|uniref:Uncharacterized protein n=1 Tax=Myxococcus xanthus TaxID=34 RepID=A0AAE6FXS6_MYXXA|nr:hypothetical protein [Myxococcus xanthus]QDE67129.1 hypothetical protein BHS09_09020 [Myxococcus xanthus]QDE74404.1 hypothetical protein BHS08_09030 [Myxococcus xanthus]
MGPAFQYAGMGEKLREAASLSARAVAWASTSPSTCTLTRTGALGGEAGCEERTSGWGSEAWRAATAGMDEAPRGQSTGEVGEVS